MLGLSLSAHDPMRTSQARRGEGAVGGQNRVLKCRHTRERPVRFCPRCNRLRDRPAWAKSLWRFAQPAASFQAILPTLRWVRTLAT
jgi:hypothetical protein